ncbi:uncharacterized protein [Battus philenor]|uniref:uncharacterized protein n=1 Tax=Battus philenor TaxID=42288 RepID=UPI0035CF8E15
MPDFYIMGLPNNIKKHKLLNLLKGIFGKQLKSRFWVYDINHLPNSNFIQVLVNIPKLKDTHKAINLINNFTFFNGQEDFQLSAVMLENNSSMDVDKWNDDDSVQEDFQNNHLQKTRDRELRPSRKQRLCSPSNNTGRSRSPSYKTKSIKLDIEIELVKKQRKLVVEERRLLLEKKKLELLKEFGPSSVQQLESFAADIEKHTLEDAKLPNAENFGKVRKGRTGLPLFVMPCKCILKDMEDITSKCDDGEKAEFMKTLHIAIRKRIATLLQNEGFLQTDQIVKLYRETYPIETDGELWEQIKSGTLNSINDAVEAANVEQSSDKIEEKTEEKPPTDKSSSTNVTETVDNNEVKNDLENDKIQSDDGSVTEDVKTLDTSQEPGVKVEPTNLINIDDDVMNDEFDDWVEDAPDEQCQQSVEQN